MTEDTTHRIVIFRDGDCFVAQCLEHDIGSQASSVEELKRNMETLLRCELEYAAETNQPIDPAPERFHKMWDHAAVEPDSTNDYRILTAA